MTNRELVSRFLDAMGKQQITKDNDIAAIVPILMADLAYSSFNSVIKDAELSHECKSIRSNWQKGNHQFFHQFFHNVDQTLENEIIDKMCEFEDYTKQLSDIVQYKVMDAVMDVPMKHQRIIAAAQFCNIMSQEAQRLWKKMYKDPVLFTGKNKRTGEVSTEIIGWKGSPNKYFEDVRTWSKKFSTQYYKQIGGRFHVELNTRLELDQAITALEKRVALWINSERECS